MTTKRFNCQHLVAANFLYMALTIHMAHKEIIVSITQQTLSVLEDDRLLRIYPISTALNGAGEREGSGRTPRGRHRIRAKIGAGCLENTVFVGRRPTGEIYSPALGREYPGRDWILSRILWLCGCEPGRNRFGSVDTMRRHIYLHGCPDTEPMGIPKSHGCIRMRNRDIIELFDMVDAGTAVHIRASDGSDLNR